MRVHVQIIRLDNHPWTCLTMSSSSYGWPRKGQSHKDGYGWCVVLVIQQVAAYDESISYIAFVFLNSCLHLGH